MNTARPAASPAARSQQTSPTPEAGFTLVELLIVMSVILILITLAIPGFEHIHIKADETSALNSMRMINSMEGEYESTYPGRGYAPSLTVMGGKPGSGTPTPEAAQLLPDDLASGVKSGYNFVVAGGEKNTVNNADQYNGYTVTATPISVGRSGNRSFCSDASGQIRFDPKGGTNCTELLQ